MVRSVAFDLMAALTRAFQPAYFRSSSSDSTSGTSSFLLFYLLDPDPLRGSSLMSPLMRIRNTAISQYTYSDPDPNYTLFSGIKIYVAVLSFVVSLAEYLVI